MIDENMTTSMTSDCTAGLLGAKLPGRVVSSHQIASARLDEIERRILAIEAAMSERLPHDR